MNDSLDCLQAYKEYLIEREMSENTIEKYLRDVRAFVRYMGGRELERAEVLRYKKELLAQYKITSANSMLTALNHFFKWLGRNELCMKTCRQQRQIFRDAEKDLTREEYRRLLQTAGREGKERLRCLLQAIAGTGMRIGELSCLTVEALKKKKIEIHFKGKQRIILIPRTLEMILRDYCRKYRIKSGCIFCTVSGKPMDRKNIWKEMKKLCRGARVAETKVFPHNLRHLFAREFYQQTGDIVKLADVLGHSSIDTTRIYVKSTGKEHKQQLDQMNMVVDHKDGGLAGNEPVRITESGIILATAENVRVMADNTYLSQRILFPLEMMCFMSTLSGSDKKKWEQWYQKIEQSDNAAGSRKNRIFPTIL